MISSRLVPRPAGVLTLEANKEARVGSIDFEDAERGAEVGCASTGFAAATLVGPILEQARGDLDLFATDSQMDKVRGFWPKRNGQGIASQKVRADADLARCGDDRRPERSLGG